MDKILESQKKEIKKIEDTSSTLKEDCSVLKKEVTHTIKEINLLEVAQQKKEKQSDALRRFLERNKQSTVSQETSMDESVTQGATGNFNTCLKDQDSLRVTFPAEYQQLPQSESDFEQLSVESSDFQIKQYIMELFHRQGLSQQEAKERIMKFFKAYDAFRDLNIIVLKSKIENLKKGSFKLKTAKTQEVSEKI